MLSLPFVPFTLALGLLAAVLILELVALLLGASLLGAGETDADFSAEFTAAAESFDLEADTVPNVDALISASEALDNMPENQALAPVGGLGGVLGLGHTPFMIWLSSLLFAFGLSGIAVQSVASATLGAPLPTVLAGALALVAGIGFTRRFGRMLGRLVPSFETTATSTQFLGGLRGVVSQGIASKDMPAEVRLRDRHGNLHHLRCEPFLDDDVIAEGTEVITVRERQGPGQWRLRILAVNDHPRP